MGRPPLRKTGAYSAAERQRRRRKKLKREQREAIEAAITAERMTRRPVVIWTPGPDYPNETRDEHFARMAARPKPKPLTMADLADHAVQRFIEGLVRGYP